MRKHGSTLRSWEEKPVCLRFELHQTLESWKKGGKNFPRLGDRLRVQWHRIERPWRDISSLSRTSWAQLKKSFRNDFWQFSRNAEARFQTDPIHTNSVRLCVCAHNLIKKGLCKVSKTSTMCYLHHFSFIRQHVIHRLKVVLLEMFDQRRNWCHMQKRKILPFQEEQLFPMSSIIAIHQPNSLASITCWIRPTTGPCPGSSLGLGNAQDIVQHKWQA